jgi:S-adenosylhomocysteine hydrolase
MRKVHESPVARPAKRPLDVEPPATVGETDLTPLRPNPIPRTSKSPVLPPGLEGLTALAVDRTGLPLDAKKVLALDLSSNLLGTLTSVELSPTLAALHRSFADWEATVGDAKQVLMPRHLLQLDPLRERVMTAVRTLVPDGPVSLDTLRESLPDAMRSLFRRRDHRRDPALADLYTALVIDAVAELVDRYRDEVIEGGRNGYGFFVAHGVEGTARKRLHRALPEQLPMVERKLDLEAWIGDAAKRGGLSRAWKGDVLSGKISARRFYADHGITDAVMRGLRDRFPAQFPPVGRRGGMRFAGLVPVEVESAKRVGAFMTEQIAADFLVRQAEICDRWNSDLKLVRIGRLDENRIAKLRADRSCAGFVPSMPTSAERLRRLLPEVRKAGRRAKSPAELLAELRKTHPGIKRNWIARVKKLDETAVPSFDRTVDTKLRRIVRRNGPADRLVRTTLPLRKLAELVLATAPPGVTAPMVNAVLDAELRGRGYPGLPRLHHDLGELRFLDSAGDPPRLRDINARRVSELVAEYARSAPKGRTLDQILRDVREDYPFIERRELNAFLRRWSGAPDRYPALAPLVRRGKLDIRGLGESIPSPRYLGGWDFARWADGASASERDAIEALTQFTRIPRNLELVDDIVALRGSKAKLNHSTLFWVTHTKADIAPVAKAFLEAGLDATRAQVVTSPYGHSDAVREAIEDLGLPVAVPALSEESYEATVRSSLDEFLARIPFPPDRSVIVLDDGGLVAKALYAPGSELAKWRPYVRIVEQTTGGVALADDLALEGPLVMVGRAASKEYESKLIASAVVEKIGRRLLARAEDIRGRNATIVGGGFVGRALALDLAEKGWSVTLVERNAKRAAAVVEASGGKVKLAAIEDALPSADLVVGATSEGTSLTLDRLKLLKNGAVIASASSRRREIEMRALERDSSSREELPEPFVRALLPDARYTLFGKTITVLGDGWPINHDGDAEGIPPRRFQITDAALVAGVFQAAGLESGRKGPIPLDPEIDRHILDAYRAMEERRELGEAATFDPNRWIEIPQAFAKRFALPGRRTSIEPDRIIDAIAKDRALSREALLEGVSRNETAARALAVHLVRRLSVRSLRELAEVFGRSTATLIYADRRAKAMLGEDPRLEKRLLRRIGAVPVVQSSLSLSN